MTALLHSLHSFLVIVSDVAKSAEALVSVLHDVRVATLVSHP